MAGFFQNLINLQEDRSTSSGDAYSSLGSGTPTLSDEVTSAPTNGTVIQQFPIGFGSYLAGILPPDVATAAGAFGVSVGQIKNITTVPVEKFAQVCMNLETIKGLNVNGTQVPTNLNLRNAARPLIALGSGPQQSYTMSDFFGCMSGLPYNGPLINIYNKLNEVATTRLFDIYHETYLAVTWEHAVGKATLDSFYVEQTPYIPPVFPATVGTPATYQWYWEIVAVTPFALYPKSNAGGGGYSREDAPNPTWYEPFTGAEGTTTVNTNDANIPGTFGRVTSYATTNDWGNPVAIGPNNVPAQDGISGAPAGPPVLPTIYVQTQCPPITGADIAGVNSAYNTAGWSGINTVIQEYIDLANDEIDAILLAKPTQCKSLNDSWNDTGYQLNIEQRARVSALRPPLGDISFSVVGGQIVETEIRNDFLSLFPTSQYTFTDSIPLYAKNIMPHMYTQTLEAICNLNTPGGQSIVAMMRESRNQNRLTEMGVTLDNNIKDTLTNLQQSILAGTPVAVGGQTVPTGTIPIATYDPTTNNTTITNPDYSTNNPADPGTTGSSTVATDNTTTETGGEVVDYGTSDTPGSFSGSEYANITPPNLNIYNISNTLLSSTYTIAEAIDDVIRCNCDCWDII